MGVLVDGDRGAGKNLPHVDGLELSAIAQPTPAPATADTSTAVLTAARSAYVTGDLDACRAELAKLDVTQLLAARQRATAARALVLDIACAWGAMDRSAARALAARLAVAGLELPDLAVAPDVEHMIGEAVTAAGRATRAALEVSGVIGGRLELDGRDAGCALPCTLDVVRGDHVVAVDADGYRPASQLVRVEARTAVTITQELASPQLAGEQWRARNARGFPAADAVGAALIARLSGQQRAAYLHVDDKLTGTLIVNGKAVATATRPRGELAPLLQDLAYDSGVLRRPAVWQRPTFWIAVTGAALVVAATTIALVYEPDRTTRLVPP